MSIRYSFSIIVVLMFTLLAATTAASTAAATAFIMPSRSSSTTSTAQQQPVITRQCSSARQRTTTSMPNSSTQLAERRWNFNEGQSPWGLKTNAEIWNGRVAQVAFVIVFVQELIQGKGVIQGVADGDPINLAVLGAFVVSTIGLTGFLALQGDDDYVNKSN